MKKAKKTGDLITQMNMKKSKMSMKSTKKKNWIAGAIKKPGALHEQLGIKKGSKIPSKVLARAANKGGKLGQRARLAETLKGLQKGKKNKMYKSSDMMCKSCMKKMKK